MDNVKDYPYQHVRIWGRLKGEEPTKPLELLGLFSSHTPVDSRRPHDFAYKFISDGQDNGVSLGFHETRSPSTLNISSAENFNQFPGARFGWSMRNGSNPNQIKIKNEIKLNPNQARTNSKFKLNPR